MNTDDSLRYSRLLGTHPEQYLRIAEETILEYPEDAQGYLDCARYYTEAERYDEALRYLDQASGVDPDRRYISYFRGTVFLRAGRYQDALQAFDESVRDRPEFTDGCLHACRATCHTYLGDRDAALAECAKIPENYFMPSVYGQFGGNKTQVTEAVQRVARANKAASWIGGLRSSGKSADDED